MSLLAGCPIGLHSIEYFHHCKKFFWAVLFYGILWEILLRSSSVFFSSFSMFILFQSQCAIFLRKYIFQAEALHAFIKLLVVFENENKTSAVSKNLCGPRHLVVLVRSGCCNKSTTDQMPYKQQTLFLTVLGSGKAIMILLANLVSGDSLLFDS